MPTGVSASVSLTTATINCRCASWGGNCREVAAMASSSAAGGSSFRAADPPRRTGSGTPLLAGGPAHAPVPHLARFHSDARGAAIGPQLREGRQHGGAGFQNVRPGFGRGAAHAPGERRRGERVGILSDADGSQVRGGTWRFAEGY